jgi:hypothetical protein
MGKKNTKRSEGKLLRSELEAWWSALGEEKASLDELQREDARNKILLHTMYNG